MGDGVSISHKNKVHIRKGDVIMVLDLNNYRVVDISSTVVADVVRINGVHDRGIPDPLGERCRLSEHIGGRGTDGL